MGGPKLAVGGAPTRREPPRKRLSASWVVCRIGGPAAGPPTPPAVRSGGGKKKNVYKPF